MTNQLDLARRSLEGLSVADALGERFFGPPAEAVQAIGARRVPPGPWRWTDDTAMALGVVEVLEARGAIDQDLLATVFARRHAAEPWRGYGGGARVILEEIHAGRPWREAAGSAFGGAGSLGNGGAMRAAPVGAWFHEDLERVVAEARASAEVTHAHPEGQAGAIAVAVAAAWAARGGRESLWELLLQYVPEGITHSHLEVASHTMVAMPPDIAAAKLGAGERVTAMDTVPFCAWVLARGPRDFAEAFWWTVSGLGDRDTTCAIVGGVVALLPGFSVPAEWVAEREPLAAGRLGFQGR